ncbi:MAG: SDR family oxidoreductase [Actinobacteria bacterium]|nr:SDR family oxidoreductase [Actinomycetota bacterium]
MSTGDTVASSQKSGERVILVSGATGYVGGRLVPRLLAADHRVRCLVRDPSRLQGRDWLTHVEVATGDVLRPAGLAEAFAGVEVAYYLIHSMAGGSGFHERDVVAARAFADAAADAGVSRIVYLGGLGDPEADISDHLRSRHDTGDALREAGVPVTEFRAAVVVGSGSISFEMIRYLTERLPVMICPKWVYTKVQPIGVDDLLRYLVEALDVPESAARVIEVGGSDVRTYGDMMLGYAQARGLRRRLQPVPVLTPVLSSYWVHLVTPIPSTIARPLIEGLSSEVIVRDDAAHRLFPQIHPVDYMTAVRAAVATLESGDVETSWADALVTSGRDSTPKVLTQQAGMMIERRRQQVAADPADVFAVCMGIGGEHGYGYADWTWEVRGAIDRLVGGVGLRRGRRDPRELRVGDALDFWRVEAVEPARLLRLRAEMKVPGRAWLQFETLPQAGGTLLVQTAYFAPRGLPGLLYWYSLYPVHSAIFSGMIAALAAAASRPAGRHGGVASESQ